MATYRKATRFGDVSIGWTYDGSRLTTRLVVPVGVRLTLHTPTALPLGGGELLRLVESGATLWSRGELQADASGRVNFQTFKRIVLHGLKSAPGAVPGTAQFIDKASNSSKPDGNS